MSDQSIPLIIRRTIPAPRQVVFAAFSQADILTRWFTPSADILVEALAYDFAPGGRYRLRYVMPDGRRPTVAGAFQQIEPPEQITMSWEWEAPDPLQGIPMLVTFRFSEADGETLVTIIHEGIPSDAACTIHADGWKATLAILEQLLDREREP